VKVLRLIGGVQPRHDGTRGIYAQDADPEGTVARLMIDRGLASGKLEPLLLDEALLAKVVADGATILARLAEGRAS
jgi:hypothetical protein